MCPDPCPLLCPNIYSPHHQTKYKAQKDTADAASAAAAATQAEVARLQAEAAQKQKLAAVAASAYADSINAALGNLTSNTTSQAAKDVQSMLQQVAAATPKLTNLTNMQKQLQDLTQLAVQKTASLQALLQKALGMLGSVKPGLMAAQVKAEIAFKKVRGGGVSWLGIEGGKPGHEIDAIKPGAKAGLGAFGGLLESQIV